MRRRGLRVEAPDEVRAVPENIDMRIGQFNSLFLKGGWDNFGHFHGRADKKYRTVSRLCTCAPRDCRSMSHGDDGEDTVSSSLDEFSKRVKSDFRTAPPDSPSRLADQLEQGSDKPRPQVFCADRICALALSAIQGHPVAETCLGVIHWQIIDARGAPKLFHGMILCSFSPLNDDCLQESQPGADQRGVTSSSARSFPDTFGRDATFEKLMTPEQRRMFQQISSAARSWP